MKSNQELIRAATAARENAHAPFSHFKVGAALLTTGDEIVMGLQCRERFIRFDDVRRARGDL
jgi:cytidine deaminase